MFKLFVCITQGLAQGGVGLMIAGTRLLNLGKNLLRAALRTGHR